MDSVPAVLSNPYRRRCRSLDGVRRDRAKSSCGTIQADAPLMLEHLKTAEEYAEGRRYIQRVAKSLGLSFDPLGGIG